MDRFMNKDDSPNLRQVVTSFPARMAVYGAIVFLVFQVVYLSLQRYDATWLFTENGPIELAQVAFLLLAAGTIAMAAYLTPIGRAALVAASAATFYAAARECDHWLESNLFDDAYKWIVGLPAAAVVLTVAYRERHRILVETLRIARYPGATLFTVAGIYLFFFCQMFDRPLFWNESGPGAGFAAVQEPLPTMDELIARYIEIAKVEESAELFAYLLVAFSGAEAVISAIEDRAKLSGIEPATKENLQTIRTDVRARTAA